MSFKSWQSYWKFSQEVQRGSRYIHSEDVKAFLSHVSETSKARETHAKAGSVFWRAQLGCNWQSVVQDGEEVGEEPEPFSPERMKPLQYEASEGRVNAKGIPYLYLATNKETAMASLRDLGGTVQDAKGIKTGELFRSSSQRIDSLLGRAGRSEKRGGGVGGH